MGTSAAVAVALLGALAATRGEQLSPRDIAYAAHQLEVDVLGVQSGIQDQLSAALGGINYLEIEPYPDTTVYALSPWDELSVRLTVVFLGRSHDSSGLHRRVIEGMSTRDSQVFSRLRDAAESARDAVIAKDLNAFGQSMMANTEAQKALLSELVGEDARQVIEYAIAHHALGWKVNGAGGDGGTITILSATPEAKVALDHGLARLDRRYRVLPMVVSRVGLQVRGTP
jgi:D-glycero-alpha-D-manno-heptose-7-phosphate kinase